ncbi:ATP synthase F0 subunit B [Blastopirellula sp. JC732]|uniref:ATP synthase subunit b n=1 Tax=Blastopirellula sediminis TaxID=2894196 RepID=A0A9X1MS11_9BACT|nr:ATP synthase F0 subunit B [Blastopirellula sediminis]MCC9605273.1 ATP synthase F0 subunit B [Blastopirellula sediminis]MCC9631427.1 ATP synthase F0 subunit B [Blastopirellula sediminis]
MRSPISKLLLVAVLAVVSASYCVAQEDKEKEPTPMENPIEKVEETINKGIENMEEAGEKAEHDAHAAAEHHADHGENPNDLSHNDAAPGIRNPEELTLDLATFNFFIFLGLAALLTIFAWKPIVAALDSREAAMDGKLAEAQKMFAAAETKLAEYNQKLADAQQEIQKSREQILKEAEEKRQQILADAQAAGNAERKRAQQEIEAAKSQAITDLTQKSVNLAIDLAGKITRQQLTPEDHQNLINDTLANLPSRN